MFPIEPRHYVLDTALIIEGLTQPGAAAGVIDAWARAALPVAVSSDLAAAYVQGLLAATPAAATLAPQLGQLLRQATFVTLPYRWQANQPTTGDAAAIDCAMRLGVPLITEQPTHYGPAQQALSLRVIDACDMVLSR